MVSVAVMKARTTSSGITKMRSGAEPQAPCFDNNLTATPVARAACGGTPRTIRRTQYAVRLHRSVGRAADFLNHGTQWTSVELRGRTVG